jgi:hypothetical protein
MTSDVATCETGDSLNRAAQIMWERRCGCVPVIEEGRLVGVLTDRDVCMAAYTQGRRIDDIAVTTAMSRPTITCEVSFDVQAAEDLMMAHGVRRLVVVGPKGDLRGVVSLDDIARSAAAWDGRGEIDLEQVALTLGEISRRTTSDDDGPEDENPETDISEMIRNSLAALRTLRDEIRVDLNLAEEEARDRWRRLESRLRAAEARARADRAQPQVLKTLLENAKQFRTRLRKQPGASAQH